MPESKFALKGDIVYARDAKTIETVENGYLICESGYCVGVFQQLPERFSAVPVTDYTGKLIMPGLVDLHLHAPQYAYRALGMDLELLPWLQTYTFPAEARYADVDYARAAYERFARALLTGATTRAAIFATLHRPATELLMELLERTGLKTYVGKVNMDRGSIDALTEETEQSAADTVDWLEDTLNRYENVRPILTPRFVPSCSDKLMMRLGEIQRKYEVPVQSHLSENKGEIALVRELCPDSSCYGAAYEVHGLFGKHAPTIMAHCVHSAGEELELLAQNGVFVAHCPQSNMNLCSGVAPVRTFLERGVRVGLGSDIAGGADLSIFCAMRDAIRASKLRWALQDASVAPLTVEEAFYLGTKGGGAFWGKVGGFEEGYEFDAVVIDDGEFDALEDFDALRQRLERVIYLANEHQVKAKYVAGRRVL